MEARSTNNSASRWSCVLALLARNTCSSAHRHHRRAQSQQRQRQGLWFRHRGGHIAGAHSHGIQRNALADVVLEAAVGEEAPRAARKRRVLRTGPVEVGPYIREQGQIGRVRARKDALARSGTELVVVHVAHLAAGTVEAKILLWEAAAWVEVRAAIAAGRGVGGGQPPIVKATVHQVVGPVVGSRPVHRTVGVPVL